MAAYRVDKREKTTGFTVQQPTMSGFGVADPAALLMVDVVRGMGISQIRVLDDKEGYQALDERGLVKYQWRTVDELIAQMRGEDDVSTDTREWLEPGIYRVTLKDGFSYEACATIDGKSKYGGRFSTVEEARAKRDEMLGGRKPRGGGRKAKKVDDGETVVIERPGREPFVGKEIKIAAPGPTGDQAELVRLFNEWQTAKREHAAAWFKTDELRKVLEEKIQALRTFLQEHGRMER